MCITDVQHYRIAPRNLYGKLFDTCIIAKHYENTPSNSLIGYMRRAGTSPRYTTVRINYTYEHNNNLESNLCELCPNVSEITWEGEVILIWDSI